MTRTLPLAAICATLGLAPFVPSGADPLSYDESLLGDIGPDFGSGPVFELAVGSNTVRGSTLNRVATYFPADPFNPILDLDPDYFFFEVPVGTELTAFSLEWTNAGFLPGDLVSRSGGLTFCRIFTEDYSTTIAEVGGAIVGGVRTRCVEVADGPSGQRQLFENVLPLAAGRYAWGFSTGLAICDGCGWSLDYTVRMTVSSLDPAVLIANLVSDVLALNIEAGVGNALDSKLQNALDALDRAKSGDAASAIGILHAFIQSVEAQRGKKLTDDQANELVAAAQAIIDALT